MNDEILFTLGSPLTLAALSLIILVYLFYKFTTGLPK